MFSAKKIVFIAHLIFAVALMVVAYSIRGSHDGDSGLVLLPFIVPAAVIALVDAYFATKYLLKHISSNNFSTIYTKLIARGMIFVASLVVIFAVFDGYLSLLARIFNIG